MTKKEQYTQELIGGYVVVAFTPREAAVVEMLLKGQTIKPIAKHFGVTIQRMRQIIAKAARRIEWTRARRGYAQNVGEERVEMIEDLAGMIVEQIVKEVRRHGQTPDNAR